MARFREVLKNRNFFLLWLGQIISQIGDRLGFMALIGFAHSRGNDSSADAIVKVLLFTIIPVFVIGPVAGVYVDRWDRRRTMCACDILRAIFIVIVPIFLFHIKIFPLAYLFVFLVFCLARLFIPAKMAIVPDLVKTKDLLIANSLINITGMIAFVVGSGVSGFLVQWFGAENGFYLDGASFVVSAAMIFFITTKAKGSADIREIGGDIVEVIRKSLVQEMKEGFTYFFRNKEIRFTAGILFTLASCLGIIFVTAIVFVQNQLGSVTKDLGLLIMFLGLGLFLGSLVYGRFGHRVSYYKTMFISLSLSGIVLCIFAVGIKRFPQFWLAAGLSLALGIIFSPILIAANTVVHKTSENDMRGKIFSSLEFVMHLGFLIFMYLGAVLSKHFPQEIILSVTGLIFTILGIACFFINRKISWLN